MYDSTDEIGDAAIFAFKTTILSDLNNMREKYQKSKEDNIEVEKVIEELDNMMEILKENCVILQHLQKYHESLVQRLEHGRTYCKVLEKYIKDVDVFLTLSKKYQEELKSGTGVYGKSQLIDKTYKEISKKIKEFLCTVLEISEIEEKVTNSQKDCFKHFEEINKLI